MQNHPHAASLAPDAHSRRDFLSTTAAVASGALFAAAAGAQAQDAPRPVDAAKAQPAAGGTDPYALAARFAKVLRVTAVTDGLDALGRADKCLIDRSVRPLWMGCRFWGPAGTMRVIPSHRMMPAVSVKDALRQHAIWKEMGGWHAELNPHLKPGCVIVTSTSGAPECGYWGSNNSMDMQSRGAAGILTDGFARDTDEIILQKNLVASRGIGRTIIPGRVELIEVNTPVGFGGVMVRPNDIVGCDWDGVVVVPQEVAEDVLYFAARIAIDDKRSRRRLYERLGKQPDETVDADGALEYFKDIVGNV
jgi:regulator of RNase E activity RraA